MAGFGDYLMAAFHVKQVPVVIVSDKEKADFIIKGHAKASSAMNRGVAATIKVPN